MKISTRLQAIATMSCLLTLTGAAPGLFAQSGAGTIQGTVQDATSAVIPSCTIHLVNQATNVAVDTTTNSTGFYAIPGLFAGTYRLTFSAQGMKKFETTLTLQNSQVLVFNPQLSLGDIAEKITVAAETLQLATYDSGTVNSELDAARIDQLPQNGRNVLGLAQNTVPGLEAGGTRINGLMGEGMEYSLDGAPMTNRNFGGEANSAQATLPDPDAVQEVRFETMNSSAQFATPATVILTTKSGTNQLHATVFETARNNYFGIAKARQNPANFAAPHLVRNEFGGTVGGPIVIPKLYNGKNRTFFFFAYERFSLRQAANELVTVPTAAMRQGDFSGLVNGAGIQQVLYDPSTTQSAANNYARTPFANNQIPITRISPLAKTLYAATPLPQTNDNPLVNSNFNAVNNTTQTVPNISFRLDHVFNPENRIYARFTDIDQKQQALRNYPANSPANIAGGGLPAGATGYQAIPIQTISHALGYSHTFSPTLFAETVVSQQWQRMYVQGNDASLANYEQFFGLPNNFGQIGFPSIGSNLLMPYGGSQWYYGMSQMLATLDENVNKIWGKQQIAFGGRIRHERFAYLSDRSPDAVNFSNQATAIYDPSTGANYGAKPNTGYQDADFFLGAASGYTQNKNAPFNQASLNEYDLYFQDNWRVNTRLTINFGLRWEMHPSPHARDNNYMTFDMANDAIVLPKPINDFIANGFTTQAIVTNLQNLGVKFETPQQGGIPDSGFFNSMANFLPRLGFAYQPKFGPKGMVIRGGYGEYIYPVPVRNSIRYLTANYPFTASYSQSYTSASQSPDGLPNYLLRAPISVVAGQNSKDVVNSNTTNSLLPGIGIGESLAAKYPPAHVREANLTVEQPFRDGSVLRVSYVYTHGFNLDQNYQYNNAPSTYVWEVTTGTTPPTGTLSGVATRPYDNKVWGGNVISMKTGWSNDSSLQMNYQRPFKKGVAYQIFYAYSRAFRLGGNTFRDNTLYPAANFAPGILPSGMDTGTILNPSQALNRYENYRPDNAIPTHRIGYNGIWDIPVGKGKRFLGNSNKFVNAVLGGYQIAYVGTVVSQAFYVSAGNWGATNPIELYKSDVPVNDCRSGVCRPAYLWFNGYLAPTVINAAKNGVTGIPSSYAPYLAPINNTPGTPNFGNNNVTITLKNGSPVTVGYSPGPAGANPFSQTMLQGPKNFQTDLSLYKVFALSERVKLRINVDAFNGFNIQGRVNPNASDGIESLQTSYWTPRQVQLTARLSF